MNVESVFVAAVLWVTTGVIGLAGGLALATNHYQTEAVKRGAAVWEVSDDGETTFKWALEPKGEKK